MSARMIANWPKWQICILLSEGSSLSARQTINALGPRGYHLEVCDPDPLCISRFSRFTRAVHRSPAAGIDPDGYLRFLETLLARRRYDVLLPTHEQAFLVARFRDRFAGLAGIAVAPFAAFVAVQGKAAFARTLAALDLPMPATEIAGNLAEVARPRPFPYYLKLDYGTAGQGVWRITDESDLARAIGTLRRRRLVGEGTEMVIQAAAPGLLCQAQAVFDRGRLAGMHCTHTRLPGMGGGFAARTGVDHPTVRAHLERLGEHLAWHGPLALDYLYDAVAERPAYIEANPRLVEPMNAALSGINLAEMVVQLSLDAESQSLRVGRAGVRSHSMLPLLLSVADRGGGRLAIVREAMRGLAHRGAYADSREDTTPARLDPPSMIPMVMVLARLLVNPGAAGGIAARAVSAYSLSPGAMRHMLAEAPAGTATAHHGHVCQ